MAMNTKDYNEQMKVLSQELANWVKHFSWDANDEFTDAEVTVIIGCITRGSVEKLQEVVELNKVNAETIELLLADLIGRFSDVFTIEELTWRIEPIENELGERDFEIHIAAGVHLAE